MEDELKKEILTKFNHYVVGAERLNVFGYELDKKMRSILDKESREEPTNLVSVYLRELRKEIIDLFKKHDLQNTEIKND